MPLIDSDTWDSRFISLNQLQFHPANPRLPELQGKASEREIIHELCTRSKIEALARSIADKGYFRQDRLIVFREDKANVVYEGNRRLCALKVLAKPDLAPVGMQRTFRRLSEKAKLPKKIAVEFVPNRFDAEVVMFSKHAGELFTVDWKPVQQATFIATKLDQGDSVEDLCATYGLRRDEVVNFRAAVDLYRLARLAELTPEAKALVDDPEQFPHSVVFERVFKPKKSREILGVDITDKGLVVTSTKERFLPLLAKVLDDAANNRIDTRSLNTEEDQLRYVEQLGFEAGGGKFTVEEIESEKKAANEKTPSAGGATNVAMARRSTKPTGRLFPRDLVSTHAHEKIHRLIEEGKRLEISHAPHASAFLLRVLLETALVVRLKSQRLWHEARAMEKNDKLGPSLAVMLDYVNANHAKLKLDPTTINALGALVSRKIKQSKPELDRIVHSPDVFATSESVLQIREQAMPLLREILRLPS
ncbi:MAG: hypothetical protein Q8N18_09550 [Opitutaceae bacterium]|nr:hypothetical protein [Opitutaceae bacterium]